MMAGALSLLVVEVIGHCVFLPLCEPIRQWCGYCVWLGTGLLVRSNDPVYILLSDGTQNSFSILKQFCI